MAEATTKLAALRALPDVWKTVKRARIETAEQVRAYRERTGSKEEKAVCDVAVACFAGVTKKMLSDGGVAIQQQVDRAYVRAQSHEMLDICELISNPHTGRGMLQLANVALRERHRSVTKGRTVTPATVTAAATVTRSCPQCGKPVSGRQLFCSGACKVKAHRAKAKGVK